MQQRVCLALPCFGFELVNSMCSHPAAHAPAAKTAAFFHARDLFARASTVLLLMSVRVAGTADRLAETGRQSRPRREAKGHGSWASLPVVPHRPAGCRIPAHAVGPGAEKWCLSKNEQRRRLLDSPPACWQRVLTQAPAAFVSEQLPQVEQTRRQPRQRCTSPAHRITARRPSLSTSKSIIIVLPCLACSQTRAALPPALIAERPSVHRIAYRSHIAYCSIARTATARQQQQRQ
jgi:hypothetical protein